MRSINLLSFLSKAHRIVKVLEPWALVLAVVFFVVERVDRKFDLNKQEKDREYDRVVNSWQLLNSKSSGNSGKTQALEYLHKKGTAMIGLDLSGNYLGDLDYSNGHFLETNLSNALLFRSDFSDSVLSYVDFSGAEFNDANMKNASATSCNFSNALLKGVNLENADLSYSDFSGAWFSSSNLQNADMSNSDLSNSKFNGFGPMYNKAAILRGANLANANLSGANLTDVDLSDVNLDGACGDYNTLLPEGIELYKTCEVSPEKTKRTGAVKNDQ